MNILIVAKTRMNPGVCIGGLDIDNNLSVRLLPKFGHNHDNNTPYEVGQIWEMEISPVENTIPPHVEDVRIQQSRLIGQERHLAQFLQKQIHPWRGGFESLFDRRVRFTGNGNGYISAWNGVPDQSTGYWIPNIDLTYSFESNKVKYCYSGRGGIKRISFVGFQESLEEICAGTLLRVSLARWWRPDDAQDTLEERCYLQLSGWYFDD